MIIEADRQQQLSKTTKLNKINAVTDVKLFSEGLMKACYSETRYETEGCSKKDGGHKKYAPGEARTHGFQIMRLRYGGV